MQRLYFQLNQRPLSLWQRIAAGVAGVAVLTAAFFIGLFALAVLFGLAVIGGVVMTIRRWRNNRRRQSGPQVLDGEYIVIRRKQR
ncbi:MAG: hypothetical protein Tsb002_25330 [Wenzhouxiangellaceae bacterium]